MWVIKVTVHVAEGMNDLGELTFKLSIIPPNAHVHAY